MFWTITLNVFYVVLGIMGFYAIAAVGFFNLIRIEKDEKGNLILDLDSWHFKFAYPLKKFKIKEALNTLEYVRAKGIEHDITYAQTEVNVVCSSFKTSICVYFAKVFWMSYFGWPAIIVLAVLKTIIYIPFMLLFGGYPIANLTSLYLGLKYGKGPVSVDVGKIPLPKIFGYRIFPIYCILSLAYGTLWYFYPQGTWSVHLWVSIPVIVALIIVVVWTFFNWTLYTDEKSVNLLREWLITKKQKVCPIMVAKPPSIE